jgi:hypothetical protein
VRLFFCVALWLALLVTPAFGQGDPIMPLDQVQRGMVCEGRSVFRGTAVETFDVEVLDVIAENAGAPAGILFRAYGPAVDGTGLGFGFSGSPIYCPDSGGVQRVIGAVALGIEDYGNDVALATPIESMLDLPVSPAPQARPANSAERNAYPLSSPLVISGPRNSLRSALISAARKSGVQMLSAPAAASQVATGTDLVPGSAVAAGMSSGTVGLTGIGTVTYRDGNRIWAFGHPLEDVGERSLIMQGAFVHTIVGNPNPPGLGGLGTYKLASPGDVAGVMDFDGSAAISGLLGSPPRTIALSVVAEDGDGTNVPSSHSEVADESPLNHPSGFPALSLVTSIAVTDQALAVARSSAGSVYGRMCTRIDLEEREAPLRFCNRYVGTARAPGGVQFGMGTDASTAASLVEEYDRSQLTVQGLRTSLELSRGDRFAVLRGASGPERARAGERIRVRIRVQQSRQKVRTLSFRVKVPDNLRPGRRTLRLTGSEADGGGDFELLFLSGFSEDELFGDEFGPKPPSTIKALAKRVGEIHRYDGIRGTFRRPPSEEELAEDLFGLDTDASLGKPVFRHKTLRIGGSAKLRFRVVE